MRLLTPALVSLLCLGPLAGASASTTTTAPSLAPVPIALGCGAGHTRDAAGHCRRKFNLFSGHRRFKAYKQRHCDRVRTPNGGVDRCKI